MREGESGLARNFKCRRLVARSIHHSDERAQHAQCEHAKNVNARVSRRIRCDPRDKLMFIASLRF